MHRKILIWLKAEQTKSRGAVRNRNVNTKIYIKDLLRAQTRTEGGTVRGQL